MCARAAVRSTFENNRSASAVVTGSVAKKLTDVRHDDGRFTAAVTNLPYLLPPCLSTTGAARRIHLLLVVVQPPMMNTSQRIL